MAPNKKKIKVPKSQAVVPRFCLRVIEDVVINMRQAFLDDGVGEQALQRMLHMWRSKMMSSKSIDLAPAVSTLQASEADSDSDLDEEPSSSSSNPSFSTKKRICGTLGTARQLDGTFDGSDEEDNDNAMLHMWRSKMMSSKSIDLAPAVSTPQASEADLDSDLDEEPCSSSSKPSSTKKRICGTLGTARQLDGTFDDSDEEDNDNAMDYNNDDDDDDDDDEEEDDEEAKNVVVEEEDDEESLNSGDDLTDDEEIEAKFETDNVAACQYDVVSRSRNKWKFIFRDGIMKIHGKEFLFKRAEGEAVW